MTKGPHGTAPSSLPRAVLELRHGLHEQRDAAAAEDVDRDDPADGNVVVLQKVREDRVVVQDVGDVDEILEGDVTVNVDFGPFGQRMTG